ncbi:hypothetical protein GDO86_002489 [Hymenochirus boettgeri]|uniref:Uncharacterized protein n=1 Tax=Hymenochirus boettgeri TaxID=247094 RepID=A0A8T2KL39_9PIPI|nr:hypothetical protein GDO86_002489 [Hymenochirus boettgeri]
MVQFRSQLNPGYMECVGPLTPCPSPHRKGNTFIDLVPTVSPSVLLSAYYPQFTGKSLQKINKEDILKASGVLHVDHAHGPIEAQVKVNWTFPKLHKNSTTNRRWDNWGKTTPGFFADLNHLQRQLVSGCHQRRLPIPPRDVIKSLPSSAKTELQMVKRSPREAIFPPILDVWAQNDAMQRSLQLRRQHVTPINGR